MRLTVLLLFLTLSTVAIGVYWINERVSGDQTDFDSENRNGEVSEARASTVPAPLVPTEVATREAVPTDQSTLYVSACIDSGDHCRCLDKQGRDLKLATQDCRAMLKLVNGE